MSQYMQATCPHCGQTCTITPEQAGQNVPCTHCGGPITVTTLPEPVAYAQPVFVVQPQTGSNGIAIASLVCSLFICFPPASLLGIIFGIIGLNKTKDPSVPGKGLAIAGIIIGVIGPIMFFVMLVPLMLPNLNVAREAANRVKCASNEKQIGIALVMYCDTNKGIYPPTLGTLAVTENLAPEVFVCPSAPTAVSVPSGFNSMSDAEKIKWVDDNSDYIYIRPPKGIQPYNSAVVVVVYEKDDDHTGGMNLLYADDHVEYQKTADAHRQIGK